jgi:hypothetical protein
VFFVLSSVLAAQQPARRVREEPVDLDVAIASGLQTISVRTGERVIQDMQVRVRRRNNRRPVAAGLLAKVHTPDSGPSATFGRGGSHTEDYTTDANGEFVIRGLLANSTAGAYQIQITMDVNAPDGTHYIGSTAIAVKNIKGGMPGWVKYVAIAGAAGIAAGACLAASCGSGSSGPDATITYGATNVRGR